MKFVFIDESGFAINWQESIKSQPFYVLGGVLIDSNDYFTSCQYLRDKFKALGLNHEAQKLGRGLEIKAKEIAKGYGRWKNDKEKRNSVRELMLSFPKTYGGISFLVIIDKQKHKDQYSAPDPPHKLALKYMFERLQLKLKELNDEAICVYDQTKILDDYLHHQSNELMRNGSHLQYFNEFYGILHGCLQIDKIKEFYLGKSDNSIGLQVADYIATFGYQYFNKGKPDKCNWWNTLADGLYNKNGIPDGFGLKECP